jgi:cyanophycinase
VQATRLLLCGGGPLPEDALALFASWADDGARRALVVTWGSQFPEDAFESAATRLCEAGFARAAASLRPPRGDDERHEFLEGLRGASAVFFSGGDQSRIMDGLAPELAAELRARFARGLPVGGTSAGTAIMSPLMIAGSRDPRRIDASAVLTREGLGLLPGTIVDQHFVRRRRHNRLYALLLENEGTLGVGVDEGAALAVLDSRRCETLGGQVLAASARGRALSVRVFEPGESFALDAASSSVAS